MKQQLNKTTALYCRLSRDDVSETDGFAKGDSMSIQTQKSMLKRYADENGYINCQFFVDDGVSGTTFARQGFQSMIAEIENGKIGTVIVKDACVIIEPTRKGPFERLSWPGSICF